MIFYETHTLIMPLVAWIKARMEHISQSIKLWSCIWGSCECLFSKQTKFCNQAGKLIVFQMRSQTNKQTGW